MPSTLQPNALTTVAALQAYLQHGETTLTDGKFATAAMELLINQISSAIEANVGRRLVVSSADETLTLAGCGGVVDLSVWGAYPIVSVTSLTDNLSGTAIAARTTLAGVGYILDTMAKRTGRIPVVGYTLSPDPEGMTVVGKWGFSATLAATTPATQETTYHQNALTTLGLACCMWAHSIFSAPNPAAGTVTLEEMSLTIRPDRVPEAVAGLLAPYRRVPLW